MSNDINDIAETMSNEFLSAVKASTEARRTHVFEIMGQLDIANQNRNESLSAVRKIREEAGALFAESIRREEDLEEKYRKAMAEIQARLDELTGKRLPKKANLKALEGGK